MTSVTQQLELERQAQEILGWTPNRIACESIQNIQDALQAARASKIEQCSSLSSQTIITYTPETITKLTGFFTSPRKTESRVPARTATTQQQHNNNTPSSKSQQQEFVVSETWCKTQVEGLQDLYLRRLKCDSCLALLDGKSNNNEHGNISMSMNQINLAIQNHLREIHQAKIYLRHQIDIQLVTSSCSKTEDVAAWQKCLQILDPVHV